MQGKAGKPIGYETLSQDEDSEDDKKNYKQKQYVVKDKSSPTKGKSKKNKHKKKKQPETRQPVTNSHEPSELIVQDGSMISERSITEQQTSPQPMVSNDSAVEQIINAPEIKPEKSKQMQKNNQNLVKPQVIFTAPRKKEQQFVNHSGMSQNQEVDLIEQHPNYNEQKIAGVIRSQWAPPNERRQYKEHREYKRFESYQSQTHYRNHYSRNNFSLRKGPFIDPDRLPDNISISLLECLLDFFKSCQTRQIILELCIMDNQLLLVQHQPILAKVTVIQQVHLMQMCQKLPSNCSGKHHFNGHHSVKKHFRKYKQKQLSNPSNFHSGQNFNEQLIKTLYTNIFNFFYYYLKYSVADKKLQRFDQLIELVASDLGKDNYQFIPFHFGVFKELCQKYLRKVVQLFLTNVHFIEANIKKKLKLKANQSNFNYLKTYLQNQYTKLKQFQYNFQQKKLETWIGIGPIFDQSTKRWLAQHGPRQYFKPNYKVHNTISRQVQYPIHLQVYEHLISYFQNISKLSSDEIFNFSLKSEYKYLQASVRYNFKDSNIQNFDIPKDSTPRVLKVLFEGNLTYDKRKDFSCKQIAEHFKDNSFYSFQQSFNSDRYFNNSHWVQLQYGSQRLVFTNSQKVFITAKTEQRIEQIKLEIETIMEHIQCQINQLSREFVYSVYLNYDYSKITSVEFLYVSQFPEKGHKVCFFKEKKFEKNQFKKQYKQSKDNKDQKQKRKKQLQFSRKQSKEKLIHSHQKEDERHFRKKKRIQAYLYPS